MKQFHLKTIIGMMVMLCFMAVNAQAFFGDNKFEKEVTKETAGIKLVREVLAGGYRVISTAALKKIIDAQEDALIIDTMPYEASYVKNHIPGALPFEFPIPLMKEWDSTKTAGKSIEDFKALLGPNKNRKLIFYCGFVKCTRSHNGALWAVKLGYTNVYRQPGGIFAWKGAKYKMAAVTEQKKE